MSERKKSVVYDVVNNSKSFFKLISDVETFVYTTNSNISKKINDVFSNKKGKDEKIEAEKQERNAWAQKFAGMDYEQDENRKNFYRIEEDQFNPKLKEVPVYELITQYLQGDEELANFVEVKEDTAIFKKAEKPKEYDRQRLLKGKHLIEDFENDIFGIYQKNEKLKDGDKFKISQASIERYGSFTYIISAFDGTKENLDRVKENSNKPIDKRYLNILFDYLTDKSSVNETSKRLFLEMHGIRYDLAEKYKPNMTDEEMKWLAVLSNQGQDANLCLKSSEESLKSVAELISRTGGENINVQNEMVKTAIKSDVDKILKEPDDRGRIIDRRDGASDVLVLKNEEPGDPNPYISITSVSPYETKHLISFPANLDLNSLDGQKVISFYKSARKYTDLLETLENTELDKIISQKRDITHEEAMLNPMSAEEKMAYQKQYQEAVDAIQNSKKYNE